MGKIDVTASSSGHGTWAAPLLPSESHGAAFRFSPRHRGLGGMNLASGSADTAVNETFGGVGRQAPSATRRRRGEEEVKGSRELLLAGLACALSTPVHADGTVLLADNQAVLAAWGQNTGGAAPEVVPQADGGTQIVWHGSVTVDAYNNTVSGGSLQTPLQPGSYYRAQWQNDGRAIAPTGDTAFGQFAVTNTNDPAVASTETQINTLRGGLTGSQYQLMVGDVIPDFSALGMYSPLRGVLLDRQLGHLALAGTAGVVAPSWETLTGAVAPTQYLRDAYAAKASLAVTPGSSLFVTGQSYADDTASVAPGTATLAPDTAHVVTGGFSSQVGRASFNGEVGVSRFSQLGEDPVSDRAYDFDTAFAFTNARITAGFHDFGAYYAALSTQNQPGIKERFIDGNWNAASWLVLSADARSTSNQILVNPLNPPAPSLPANTHSATTGETLSLGKVLAGLSAQFSQSVGKGHNVDGSRNNTDVYAESLSLLRQAWSASVGYSSTRVLNDDAPTLDGTVDTWTGSLAWQWGSFASGGTWGIGPSLSASRSREDLGDATLRMNSYTVSLPVQWRGLGSLTPSVTWGDTDNPSAGPTVYSDTVQILASHPLRGGGSTSLYVLDTRMSGGTALQNFSTRVVGVELVHPY